MATTPLKINQLIANPWTVRRNGEVKDGWAATEDDGAYIWERGGGWTNVEALPAAIDSTGVAWKAICGDIAKEGAYALIGVISGPTTSEIIFASTVDNGETFALSPLGGTEAVFRPEMLWTPRRWHPEPYCDGKEAGYIWDPNLVGALPWEPDGNYIGVLNSSKKLHWQNYLFTIGNFGRNIPANQNFYIYMKASGNWAESAGSYVFRAYFSTQNPCFSDEDWKLIATWKSAWSTNGLKVQTPSWPAGGVDSLCVAVSWMFDWIPEDVGLLIDGIWSDANPPNRWPYNVVVETAEGRWAYGTAWVEWSADNSEYQIELYRFDLNNSLGAEGYERCGGPILHGGVGIGHPTGYKNPEHALFVAHPYGWPANHLLLYGGQNASLAGPYFGWEHDFDDTTPVVMKAVISEGEEGCCPTVELEELHPAVAEGWYVGHASAATENADDIIAFVNKHSDNSCRLYQSLNGGVGWLPPRSMQAGRVGWNAAHRHPADGKAVIVGQGAGQNKVYLTEDLETWQDITNAVLGAGIIPVSAFFDWSQ